MISAVHLHTFNYGPDMLAMVLYETTTGTIRLMDKRAAMDFAGILHQPTDSSPLLWV